MTSISPDRTVAPVLVLALNGHIDIRWEHAPSKLDPTQVVSATYSTTIMLFNQRHKSSCIHWPYEVSFTNPAITSIDVSVMWQGLIAFDVLIVINACLNACLNACVFERIAAIHAKLCHSLSLLSHS
jgi:hypothetical protein